MDEDFMRKNPDMVDWEHVEKNYDLSDDFINDFGDRMNFEVILTRFKLSERTLENYISDIDKLKLWNTLFWTQKVSESFIRKYSDRYEQLWYMELWYTIVQNQNVSDDLIIEYIKFMDLEYLYRINPSRKWSDSMILLFKNAGVNVDETK